MLISPVVHVYTTDRFQRSLALRTRGAFKCQQFNDRHLILGTFLEPEDRYAPATHRISLGPCSYLFLFPENEIDIMVEQENTEMKFRAVNRMFILPCKLDNVTLINLHREQVGVRVLTG